MGESLINQGDMEVEGKRRKIKDGNPSIKSTRQMRTQVDTTQSKNKSKHHKSVYIMHLKIENLNV